MGYRLQSEASARLERASEAAALRNESSEVEQSILSLDTSISAALSARDAQKRARHGNSGEPEAPIAANRGQVLTPDEIQKAAQEKWLKYREHHPRLHDMR